MGHKHLLFALSLGLAAMAPEVLAVGTFVPAAQRRDMVYDDARDIVFITNNDRVLRYHVGSGTFLSPIVTGGYVEGIDLSPDGNTLAVADSIPEGNQAHVYLVPVRPVTGTGYLRPRKISTPSTAFNEGGIYSVAYASDGTIRAAPVHYGYSGWGPMRKLDPATRTWTRLSTVTYGSMVAASGDGDTIAYVMGGISSGDWGYADIPTGQLIASNFQQGTSWFNFEVGTDRTGSQFAIPTYNGTYIYNEAFQQITRIGTYAGPQPIGVAYHPVRKVAYFPWAQTNEVRVYDMESFTHLGSYDFEYGFTHTGNGAYNHGRTRISRDGSLLMVSVSGGIRVLRMYAPLEASPVSFTATQGSGTTVTLPGSIGNGDPLAYSLGRAPANGQASVSGEMLTYTPLPGFTGTDTFTYRVRYGSASREAQVDVQVVAAGASPVTRARAIARPSAGTMRHAPMARDILPRSLGTLATRARLDP